MGYALTALDNGQISGAWSSYGFGGLLTDKKEDDYGLIPYANTCQNISGSVTPPGGVTPTRETAITYAIFDRPSTVKTYGSGTLAAETDNLYDQTGVGAVSNLPTGTHDETNYGPSFNTRGNATTVTHKCLQNCPDAITKYTYDETGQALTMTDPFGNATCSDMPSGVSHTTTFSYADSYDSPPSANTNAYFTKVTSPSTNAADTTATFK